MLLYIKIEKYLAINLNKEILFSFHSFKGCDSFITDWYGGTSKSQIAKLWGQSFQSNFKEAESRMRTRDGVGHTGPIITVFTSRLLFPAQMLSQLHILLSSCLVGWFFCLFLFLFIIHSTSSYQLIVSSKYLLKQDLPPFVRFLHR